MSVRGPALSRASAPAFSRLRLGAYICAGLLHAGAIGAIAALPPEALERFVSTGTSVEVRFFTISASDAESDLPLNAPLLADRGQAGADSGADTGNANSSQSDAASDTEGEELTPEEPETPPDTAVEAEPDNTPPAPVSETGTRPADPDAPETPRRPAQPRTDTAGRAFSVTPPDTPVDTILPEEEDAAIVERRIPTFASIAARAETGLRVEDFQVSPIEGGVSAVIAEVFCLSSGDANREIGDCGDGPNAAQAELAVYHLRAISRGPLEFAENMSRLEFELAQLGVSPSTLQMLRVHMASEHREQTRRSPLLNAMERDRSTRTDHLGIGPSITPQRARDPSGER
ncbi:hypothetical protein AB6B38_02185 [Glycocaulis abyssi]|uniref:hypothetical protein n=1 Tax=Glycocaulis abyssi TaxID=1433403 RepID=UPI00352B4235